MRYAAHVDPLAVSVEPRGHEVDVDVDNIAPFCHEILKRRASAADVYRFQALACDFSLQKF